MKQKWCIFPQTTQEEFLTAFLNPTEKERSHTPSTTKPGGTAARSITPAAPPAAKSKWKTVEAKPEAFNPESAVQAAAEDEDVDGVPMADDDDVDGEPMVDEDVDGEPMVEDEDVDGEPMKEDGDDADGEPMKEDDEGDQELKEMFDAGSGIGNDPGTERPGLGSGTGMMMAGFKMGGAAIRGGRGGLAQSGGGPRKRMRAEDMFADDDED